MMAEGVVTTIGSDVNPVAAIVFSRVVRCALCDGPARGLPHVVRNRDKIPSCLSRHESLSRIRSLFGEEIRRAKIRERNCVF
jgi:hypothetical protein